MSMLGVRFNTPLVNIRIASNEFVRFVLNYRDYLSEDLQFVDTAHPYPVAMLGDITLFFAHYTSQKVALCKWEERKQRIVHDRLFFMLNDCDGITDADLTALDECHHPNIVVFTSTSRPTHRCAFYLPTFEGQPTVGNTMTRDWLTGRVMIEKHFDLVGWLNQEKGSTPENYRL